MRRCRDRRGVDADYDNGITLLYSLHCWWSDGGHALEALELWFSGDLEGTLLLVGKALHAMPYSGSG